MSSGRIAVATVIPSADAPHPSTAPASAVATSTPAPAVASHVRRSILSLLTDTVVSEFAVTRGKVLCIDARTAPGPAFEQILAAGVLSAPVYDTLTQRYIGFLELSDLLRLVVSEYDRAEMIALLARGLDTLDAAGTHNPLKRNTKLAKGGGSSAGASAGGSASTTKKSVSEYIDEILAASRLSGDGVAGTASKGALETDAKTSSSKAHTTPTLAKELTVAALAKRHPFVSVPQTATLFEAGKLLCVSAHRVCVTDEQGAVCNVISQSTVIQFLHSNLSRIDATERTRSVEDWHIGSRPVHSSDMCARAIDVFRRMMDVGVSGMALIDEFGSYVDFVQSSDLKIFMALFFHQPPKQTTQTLPKSAANAAPFAFSSLALEEPINELLNELRQLEASHRIAWTMPSSRLPLTIATNAAPSLEDVITRLAATHSHQLTITSQLDEYLQIPMLMVSLGDILRGVYRYVPPEIDANAIAWVGRVQKAANDSAKTGAEVTANASKAGPVTPTPPIAAALGAVDSKHSPDVTVAATVAALPKSVANAFTAAAEALVKASTELATASKDAAFEPLLREMHRKYEAVAALASSFPRQPVFPPPKPTTIKVAPPPIAAAATIGRDTTADHALPKAFNSAFNQCHHTGEHLFSDHGHCLRATHTCARLHGTPPACEWTDGRRFCVFDLGYTAGERLEREAHAARPKRLTDAATALSAELHAAAAAKHH